MLRFRLFFAVFIVSSFWICYSQNEDGLSIETRAYLFHIVKKSPILERNIGKAFDYTGPIIKLPDGKLNYDSIELIIVNEPSLLIIRNNLIATSPKGLIAEASNKTAIWELCKQIQLVLDKKNKENTPLIDAYLSHFFDSIPKNIIRGKIYDELLNPSTSPILQTSLSLNDRIIILDLIGIKDKLEQKQVLDAQNYAINKTIKDRSFYIYNILGGQATDFENILFASGDGSYTTGLLEERDKDENGEWNKGLPKAIGLFPYDIDLVGGKKKELEAKRICSRILTTVGNDKLTQLHFDVWGYNTSKQTTVVIERNNQQYHLFGSEKTRFLSPDSTFSKGITFQRVINDLDNFTFKSLKNSIEGKGGYDEQIKMTQKYIAETLRMISEQESKYSNLESFDYVTKKKPSRSNRKLKKKNKNGGPISIQPTTKSRRTAKTKKQTELIDLYGQYDELKALEEELIGDRIPVLEEYTLKKKVLDSYRKKMGENWISYTEKDGLYTYSDGATFDIYTQEFSIPPAKEKEELIIRLIAIPEDFEGESSDEVMLHISKTDAQPYYDSDFQLKFEDRFDSDKYNFSQAIFTPSDTSILKLIFQEFNKKVFPCQIQLQANGVGIWNGEAIIRDEKQTELNGYPGGTTEEKMLSRQSLEFKQLRSSNLFIKIDRALTIKVNSFTDPVISSINLEELRLKDIAEQYKLSKNELLSALRCITLIYKLKEELAIQATNYLTQTDSKKFIDKLDGAIQKSKIQIGNVYIRIKDIQL
jgi:hypothetical protein